MSTKVAIVPVKVCQQNCVTRTSHDSDVGLETRKKGSVTNGTYLRVKHLK